jgi:MFS family permease
VTAGGPRRGATVGVVFLALFLDCLVFGMLFPLTERIFAHYQQADEGLYALARQAIAAVAGPTDPRQEAALFGGVLIGLYALTQFVSAPFWGRISDRIGRRPVILISLAGTVAANLLWAFTDSFAWLVASRLLAGGLSGSVVVANAAVADITPPEGRARAMGLVGMAFGLGFVLGPAIGGMSYELRPAALDAWLHPFACTALVAAGLAGVNLILAWRGFGETLDPARRQPEPAGARTANPLRLFSAGLGPLAPRINLVFAAYTLLFAGMETTLVFLAAQRLDFSPADNVWLFLAMGLTTAAMQGAIFRPLAPRFGSRRLGVVGLAASIPGMACLAVCGLGGGEPWLWTGSVLLSVGTGLVFPALSTLVSLASDPARQGFAMGAFRSAGSLGRAAGPFLGAFLYFAWGPAAPYLLAAACLALPLFLLARIRLAEPTAA